MSTHNFSINQHILDYFDKSYEHHQKDFFFSRFITIADFHLPLMLTAWTYSDR